MARDEQVDRMRCIAPHQGDRNRWSRPAGERRGRLQVRVLADTGLDVPRQARRKRHPGTVAVRHAQNAGAPLLLGQGGNSEEENEEERCPFHDSWDA